MDTWFLVYVDAQKGRWRDVTAEAKGISTQYSWLDRGRVVLEITYGSGEVERDHDPRGMEANS